MPLITFHKHEHLPTSARPATDTRCQQENSLITFGTLLLHRTVRRKQLDCGFQFSANYWFLQMKVNTEHPWHVWHFYSAWCLCKDAASTCMLVPVIEGCCFLNTVSHREGAHTWTLPPRIAALTGWRSHGGGGGGRPACSCLLSHVTCSASVQRTHVLRATIVGSSNISHSTWYFST